MKMLTRLGTISLFVSILFGLILFVSQSKQALAAQQGGIVFIDQDGTFISGDLRILCLSSATPPTVEQDIMRTVSNGFLASPLPASCQQIAVMWLRHEQPAASVAHGPAYWIYTTNWGPGATTGQPADGTILLDDANSLTLFNVMASIGWEPALDSDILTVSDVASALESASAEIHDWTEGHAAFGPITIGTNGQNWRHADLRFLPNNDQRPGAFVGGIVDDDLAYTTDSGFTTTYIPGTTFYGREWRGNISEPNGYKTIAHEWMHYAFFLYDEYVQDTGEAEYCVCNDLPAVTETSVAGVCSAQTADLVGSAMAYHYTASELWHEETHTETAALCTASQQFTVHGESDWDTLSRWDEIQGLSLGFNPFPYPTMLTPGPDVGITGLLFGRIPPHSTLTPPPSPERSAPLAANSEPTFTLQVPDRTNTFTTTIPSQVYLLKGDVSNPSHIQYQGEAGGVPDGPRLGELKLVGVDSNDFVRAYANEYEPFGGGRSLVYPSNPSDDGLVSGAATVDAFDTFWNYTLETDVALFNSKPQTMTVYLKSVSHPLVNPPQVQLCSQDLNVGCLSLQTMSFNSAESLWSAQLVATDLGLEKIPAFSIVRVVASDAPYPGEIIRWVQLAGSVGPAYVDGLAPLTDDRIMVLANDLEPDVPDCNLVSFMPAASVPAASSFGTYTGILGQPLDITMRMSDGQNCVAPPPCVNQAFDDPVTLVMFFDPLDLTRLDLDASMLSISHFDTDQFSWQTDIAPEVNEELGFVSIQTNRDGIYMLTYNRPLPTGPAFIHTTTNANINASGTTIDHPALNGLKGARPIVTHNWNPGGGVGTYHDHNIGVFYDTVGERWQIHNQDMALMPANVHFNVLVPAASQTAFRHTHNTAQNAGYDETYLDESTLNFFALAKPFVTQSLAPNIVYNDRVTGVAYDQGALSWVIQNSLEIEFDPVPNLAAYNVMVPSFDQDAFIHTATAANTSFNTTDIDHPRTNGNPSAIVFITPRWPFSNSPTGNWHPTGVYYNVGSQRWAIYNEDLASMPVGTQFNVLIPTEPAMVPTAVQLADGEIAAPVDSAGQLLLLLIVTVSGLTLAGIVRKRGAKNRLP